MSFFIDKQTLEDLNILGKYKNNSIFSLFCHTKTHGGETVMEQMFHNPLSDTKQINKRAGIFKFFIDNQIDFSFDAELIADVEQFMGARAHKNGFISFVNTWRVKFMCSITKERDFELIESGIFSTIKLLKQLKDYVASVSDLKEVQSSDYADELNELKTLIESKKLKWIKNFNYNALSVGKVARYNFRLRSDAVIEMMRIMNILYNTDVYITVAKIARDKKMTVAQAIDSKENCIDICDLFHPQLKAPVSNSVKIDYSQNVFFLTGANMAGKSTFMKSFGIAVYLAHIGFPVATSRMIFTTQDGIYTSINVSDNINLGYSHFYAEVVRVKNVALEVSKGKRLVVIFDELFKGTNVKDAYDATVATVEAFAENRQCIYIISTHIVEAGNELKNKCSNFKFRYFPSKVDGSVSSYTYKLEDGISGDRHGMAIIRNERIIEIINGEGVL